MVCTMANDPTREIPESWWEDHDGQSLVIDAQRAAKLILAVRDYLSESDNPVPDASYRRILRNRLRPLVDAPPEPPPRRL